MNAERMLMLIVVALAFVNREAVVVALLVIALLLAARLERSRRDRRCAECDVSQ